MYFIHFGSNRKRQNSQYGQKNTATFNNSVNTEYDDGMHYCYLKVKSVIFFGITIFLLP